MPDQFPEGSLTRPLSEIKAELFRALAHPARVRVLELLADGERSVGDMAPQVGIELSHLSQQLAVLRRAGLVVTRKEGSTVFYAVRDPAVVEVLAAAKRVLITSLTESQELLAGLRTEAAQA
jgi:DNA-binding transcriptional ArsR family regulator